MKHKLLIFAFTLSAAVSVSAQDWQIIGEMKSPVAGARAFVNSRNIYVLGGYSDSTQNYVDWIQKYSTFLGIWKNISHMNFKRYGHSSAQTSDSIFYFGGTQNTEDNNSSLEKWKAGIDAVQIDKNSIFNRGFGNAELYDDRIILVGGNPLPGTGNPIPYVAVYNVANLTVEYQLDTTFAVGYNPEQQMTARIGEEVYIFGGALVGVSQDISVFNIADSSIKNLNVRLISPRAGGATVIDPFDENSVYIIGGYNEGSSAMSSVEKFTKLAPDSYSISASSPLNIPRTLCSAAVVDDLIYVLGGYDMNGNVVKEMEIFDSAVTGIENGKSEKPDEFKLEQNYPNPFGETEGSENPSTVIKYTIPAAGKENFYIEKTGLPFVQLKIFDLLGREVASLVNRKQEPGNYSVEFNAENLAGGIYIYRLTIQTDGTAVNNFSAAKKMIFLK